MCWQHEWSKDGKSAESVDCWHASLANEIEAEIDMCIARVCTKTQSDQVDDCTPTIDCPAKGFDRPGVVPLFGGDHGDENCPINCKLNLSSPDKRKQAGKLGIDCPIVQFASVRCSKDAHLLMENTVMKAVAQEISKMQRSCVITVHNKLNPSKGHRSCVAPKSIKSVAFLKNCASTIVTHSHSDGKFGSLELDRRQFNVPIANLGWKKVVSAFHDLHIGDLAFQAMLIGMNNSDGDWCLLCNKMGSTLNNGEEGVPRTPETQEKHLLEHKKKHAEKKAKGNKNLPANHMGVNSEGLASIDPQRIVVPLLRCPMGLVDKALESFLNCIACEVERLDEEATVKRTEFWSADEACEEAKKLHQQAKKSSDECKTPVYKKLASDADRARIDTNKARTVAKDALDKLLKKHNATKASLKQRFESVHKENGITREHHHGGKFNGVNCVRTMERAKSSFDGFAEVSINNKMDSVDPQSTRDKCSQCERLLGVMDFIWSNVRGIDSGLLPAGEQTQTLAKALEEGKHLWLVLGLTTKQPKWHLAFEGHLLEQVLKCGGPADKSDESTEAFHQDLKALRDRFRGTQSHKRKETAMRRELRRKRNPKVMQHVDDHIEKSKLPVGNKRSRDARDRKENKKKAKIEKRLGCVNNNSNK